MNNSLAAGVPSANHFLDETLASRLLIIIGSESVSAFARRSGVGESLVRKYLNGAQPSAGNLVLLADAGACTIDWLAAGRLPKVRAERQSQPSSGPMPSAESDEFVLLQRYRQADIEQRAAVMALLDAITNPGGMSWYRAGEAITRIANIFPRKPK